MAAKPGGADAPGPAEVWDQVWARRGLCDFVARRYLGRGLDREDLVQEGLIGLYRAVQRYDPGRVGRGDFGSYACLWIRQAMRDALCYQGRAVHIPRHAYRLAVRALKGKLDLRDLKPGRRRCVVAAMLVHTVESIDTLDAALFERLEAPYERPDLEAREILETVRAAFERLHGRHREVIRLRFGLDGDPPMLLREVGESLGLTRERIRQIQDEAMAAMLADAMLAGLAE